MITGFNTDIVYQGVTYHVQTEDKGLKTPLILSLVYDRGTILASKRSPYNDLLDDNFNEKELAERLQKQHNLICAAIRAGRIEDLKRMTMKESAAKQSGSIAQREAKIAAKQKEAEIAVKNEHPQQLKTEKKTEDVPLPQVLEKGVEPIEKTLLNKPAAAVKEKTKTKSSEEDVWEIPLSIIEDAPFFEEVQVVEEETILPAEAVEIITDSAKIESFDNSLKIELLGDMVFKSGERKTLTLTVRRGNAKNGLDGAHVMVKVIGSSFRPLIFHAKTDSDGIAIVPLQLPHFRAGRAAILVKAMAGGEEVELRRVIQR